MLELSLLRRRASDCVRRRFARTLPFPALRF
jgi:hypothetical protein